MNIRTHTCQKQLLHMDGLVLIVVSSCILCRLLGRLPLLLPLLSLLSSFGHSLDFDDGSILVSGCTAVLGEKGAVHPLMRHLHQYVHLQQ